MRGCAQSQHSKVTALVTGHADTKGEKYAAQYNIPNSSIYTYETFDQIKNNPDVDAVYIGLPNSMHKEYTLRAAAAGKHVLWREADGDLERRVSRHDRRLQGREREADDRLPHPVRAHVAAGAADD